MTREDIRDLVASALEKCKDGKSLNESIKSVISGKKLTDEQIKRIIESANHSFMNAVYKDKADKEFAFEVATFEGVKNSKVEAKDESKKVETEKVEEKIASFDADKAFELRMKKLSKSLDFDKIASAGLSECMPLFAILAEDCTIKQASEFKYEHLKEASEVEALFEKSKVGGQITDLINKDKNMIKKVREAFKKVGFFDPTLASNFLGNAYTGIQHGLSAAAGMPFNDNMMQRAGIMGVTKAITGGETPKFDQRLSPVENAGKAFKNHMKNFFNYIVTGRGGMVQ